MKARSKSEVSLLILLGLLLVCAQTLGLSRPLEASENMPEIHETELLTYEIKWGFFHAGQATLEIRHTTTERGNPVYELQLEATTTGLFGVVYPLQVLIQSTLSENLQRSLAFHKVQNTRDTRIEFDWDQQTAQYIFNGEKHEPIALPVNAIDPLALIAAIRTQQLRVGSSLTTNFTDGKRNIKGIAGVVGEETIETDMGAFATAKIIPVLKNVGGVFAKSRNPKMEVWISQDERRLPVRISSKIMLGHIVGELVEIKKTL